MSFSLQTQALAILAILVYNEENAALADSAASLLTLGIEFSTVSDCMVRLTAMELLLELSERIDLLPVTSRLTLLSIFTSVILDGGNRDVWRPALDGIAALLNSEFTRLEKQMPTIEKAILMGLHSGNEMVILSALRCFPCLYEFASVKDIHAFHENIDYVLLCSVLRSNDIEAQKCVLNAFGQMVKRGFEDWFEAMVNYSIFHRIMEFTLTSVFEIKVGIAKIFGCALGMASEALTAHLLDIGALQLMVDVLDPGMTIDDRLQIEFFGIFESLFERFPRLIPTLQEALLTRENLEFMLGLEPQDEMTAAAYQRFMHVIQPQEGSA
jgi:hypothetical protein